MYTALGQGFRAKQILAGRNQSKSVIAAQKYTEIMKKSTPARSLILSRFKHKQDPQKLTETGSALAMDLCMRLGNAFDFLHQAHCSHRFMLCQRG